MITPGTDSTLTLNVSVHARTDSTVTNTVTLTPTDSTPANNTATDQTTVQHR
jgi:hypothetical protein